MNQELSSVEQIVMRRVYAIWFCRACAHSIITKLSIFVFLLAAIYINVSPGMIWQNVQTSGGLTNYHFFVAALMNTEVIVQVFLMALILALAWLAKDLLSRLWPRVNLSTLTGFFSRVRS